MFLVLRRLLVLHRLGMFAGRVTAIAHGRILACSVLIALCRVFLLFGAIFVPSGIAVADLGHARRCRKNVLLWRMPKKLAYDSSVSLSPARKSGSGFW